MQNIFQDFPNPAGTLIVNFIQSNRAGGTALQTPQLGGRSGQRRRPEHRGLFFCLEMILIRVTTQH